MFKGHILPRDFHFINSGKGLRLGGLKEDRASQHVCATNEAKWRERKV